jgi:hypothetical protein
MQKTPLEKSPFFWFGFFGEAKKMNKINSICSFFEKRTKKHEKKKLPPTSLPIPCHFFLPPNITKSTLLVIPAVVPESKISHIEPVEMHISQQVLDELKLTHNHKQNIENQILYLKKRQLSYRDISIFFTILAMEFSPS